MAANYKRLLELRGCRVTLMSCNHAPLRLQGRNYLLTYPHCDAQPQALIEHLRIRTANAAALYIICCTELHKDGTPHAHAFIRTRSVLGRVPVDWFDFGGRHPNISAVRNVRSTVNYVKKDGKWSEYGEDPVKEARTTTKDRNEKILRDGIAKCVEDGTIALQSVKRVIAGVQAIKMLSPGARSPTVFWFFGKTGTGKTRRAFELCGEDVWISGENLKWFDGYQGQANVIFDDLRTNSCSMNFLLRLLDRYRLFVPIKGGFADWRPTTIVITCPVPRVVSS